MIRRIFIAILVAAVFVSPMWAQVIGDENDPEVLELRNRPITDDEFRLVPDEGDEAKIDSLVARLSGPDYAARQSATTELVEIGGQAFSRLRDVYHRTDDLETRLRIESVVRSAYLNHHVLDRHGFLGISMNWLDDARLAQLQDRRPGLRNVRLEGRVGVWLSAAIPGTGAAKAGLKEDDVLIGLNGTPIEGSGEVITQNFSAIIRQHPPGSRIELEVMRGAERFTVEAVLGRPPEDVARNSRIIKVTALFHVVSERFHIWWERYFLNPEQSEADGSAP